MQEQEPTARARDYLSLLWIVAAAVLGMSLLCGVAAMGINDINNAALIGTPTVGIVNFVISNMNTLVVETAQGFSQPLQPSETLSPSPTNTGTAVPTGTHVIIHYLPGASTLTKSPHSGANPPQPVNVSSTPAAIATNTLKPIATNTLIPTNTPKPPPTNTLIPTATLVPTVPPTLVPTDIPTLVPTDIPTLVPTDIPTLVPTDIPTLVPTDIPTPIPTEPPTPIPTDPGTPAGP